MGDYDRTVEPSTQAMAQSQHAHDADPTDREPRGTDRYCTHCGRKLSEHAPTDREDDDDRRGARRLEPAFCDDDCERAWNIDATRPESAS